MTLTRRAFGLGLGAVAVTSLARASEPVQRARLHVPRYGPALATDGTTAILAGGAPIGAENQDDHVYSNLLSLVESIDPRTLDQVFRANAIFPRANHAAIWVDGQLWLLGGRTRIGEERRLAFETERIDLEEQAIWRGPDLSVGLIHLAAVVVGKSVFVFGGVRRDNESRSSVATAEVYECAPPYTSWEARSPMPVALGNGAAVVVGNKVYVIGGYDQSQAQAITQIYDPDRDTWSAGPPPPAPLSAHAAAALDGHIYTFGDYQNQASTFALSLESGTWRTLELPFSPRRHVRAVAVGKRIVVAGGNQTSYAPASDVVESFPAEVLSSALSA